jgi:negative elongation factor B
MNSVKSNNEPGNGLEDLDIPGQVFLRDALTSCTDPLKAIEEFQVIKIYVLSSIL